jgi:hypothetical protein
VILRVLQEAQARGGRQMYRTALVKLVYLVDYIYAEHTGHTLTGFDYIWDDHGPNARGNEIVKQADRLESPQRKIEIDKGVTPSGNPKWSYRVREGIETVSLRDQLGERIVRDVIMTYGNLNWSDIVKASKSTRPVLRAKPGDPLDLTPDTVKQKRLARVTAMFGERDYDTKQRGVPMRELMTKYGLPA